MEVNLSIMTKDQLKKFIVELEKENKSLNEEIERLKQNIMQDELEIIPKLEKENKNLKEELAEQYDGANGLHDEIGYWKRECKKLKAELDKWQQGKYRYFGNDGETDLYEDVGDDELIYEEGLYD